MIKNIHPGSRSRFPDPDLDFLPIPDPGSRGQKGSGSATLLVLQHIWRPWDENNPVGDWPGTYLTSRIRLHFDLVNKSGKKIRLKPDTSTSSFSRVWIRNKFNWDCGSGSGSGKLDPDPWRQQWPTKQKMKNFKGWTFSLEGWRIRPVLGSSLNCSQKRNTVRYVAFFIFKK